LGLAMPVSPRAAPGGSCRSALTAPPQVSSGGDEHDGSGHRHQPGRATTVLVAGRRRLARLRRRADVAVADAELVGALHRVPVGDRKSTRLNSSHVKISYAVFCLKKKT